MLDAHLSRYCSSLDQRTEEGNEERSTRVDLLPDGGHYLDDGLRLAQKIWCNHH